MKRHLYGQNVKRTIISKKNQTLRINSTILNPKTLLLVAMVAARAVKMENNTMVSEQQANNQAPLEKAGVSRKFQIRAQKEEKLQRPVL